ncbi:MerR family transcriptional regulator [Massilimicrobiota sp. An142]|uniref:MerR family transcriptional regulator n=1 Tax=Massilimicrobiota sp. An142 TaxID=1965564 RepID=UPI001302791A|nr:MerR family transcriptional regulator [Massilimicrobiota sp. An142]
MHIQEVSQQLNLSKKTIMIYEQKRLIHPQKDAHGYRVYQQKDIERLMQIKCLRQLDFSISQIKDILINNQYDIFDLKKEEYEKQIFDIETSLQYIDDVKKSLTQKQTLDNLSHQLEQTKQLKKINSSTQTILPFEKIIICLSIFIYALFLFDNDSFLSILASLAMLLILVIHFSSTFRLFLYEIYQKIKK